MTTYCIDPTQPFVACYNLNTWTMPTTNVAFSHLLEDIADTDTSITITDWEEWLFKQGMIATLEQLNVDWKVILREVILINSITNNVLWITRGYEQCVLDDTATHKELSNTPQNFTAWTRLSVYVSRALLNWAQTRLQQVNLPLNEDTYCRSIALTECILCNCDTWRDKLYKEKARLRCNDCWFWDWSLWDCVMTGCVFLNANCDYNFRNLTICSWALVRFCWNWTPRINVQKKFCNLWTIDLRGWTFVWTCCKCDWLTHCCVCNKHCSACYNTICFGKGWAWWGWYWSWTAWANASWSSWWAWWNWGCWYQWHYCRCWSYWTVEQWSCWSAASWYNGWNWGNWYWPASWECDSGTIYGCDWWGWGWGGWYRTWNWWNWWNAWGAGWYGYYRGCWGNGWWGWVFWKWWKWGNGWTCASNCNQWFSSWNGWNWWDWYIGWDWWTNAYSNKHGSWNGWNGWKWIICWWQWADRVEADYMINGCSRAWNGWMAITNMYWLIIHACEFYNTCIMAKWWDWGRWWDAPNHNWSSSWSNWNTWGCWWTGACGACWGQVSIAYIKLCQQWTINISWWAWWRWWYNNCQYWTTTQNAGWANWWAGWCKLCKPF